MLRDGTLEPHDVSNGRVADELLGIIRGEDGLFWTAKFFAGFDRLNERVHKQSSRWFQREISVSDAVLGFRDPRSSGKTSGTTKTFPFWLWAQEPMPGTPIQGINTRVGIVAPKKDIASYNFIADVNRRFLAQTPGIQAYRALCPWVRPNKKHWSNRHGLLLERTEEGGEPSLMPIGMEGVVTSAHFHIMFIDDPIHEQNYRSETLVRQCIDWMYLSYNLVAPEHGARAFIGNFWRTGDVQDQLRPSNPKFTNVKVWERGLIGCEECVENRFPLDKPAGPDGIPPELHECLGETFPIALLDVKADDDGQRILVEPGMEIVDLARNSVPSYQFATQNMNRPASADTLHLKREWLKYYSWHYDADGSLAVRVPIDVPTAVRAAAAGDERIHNPGAAPGTGPRGNLGTGEILPLYEFDMYILIDPASSEEAGPRRARFSYVVAGRHRTRPMTLVFEEYAENKPQHEHLHAVLNSYLKWRPYLRRIAYESVAYQATLSDALLTVAHDIRHITMLTGKDIIGLSRLRGEGPQEDRIKYVLMPMMESGTLYVNRDHRKFIGEVDTFGIAGAVRDLLDALSNGPRVWGVTRGRYNRGGTQAAVAAARKRASQVDVTGYGA